MSPKRSANLTIEHALLGFLQDGSLHGYELHQRLQAAQALGLVWQIKQAHLYALLAKLEEANLVAVDTSAPADENPAAVHRGRARKPLLLTAAGRAAFERWREAPVAHGRDLRIEFLAKLFWAEQGSAADAQQLLARQRAICAGWLDELDRELTALPESKTYPRLVRLFRRGQIEAMLTWLDTCAARLADIAHHA